MIEQVPAVAYAWDPAIEPGAAPAAYISPQIERLLGFTADQWLEDPDLWSRQVHRDDLGRVLSAWTEAVEAERAIRGRVPHRDGRRATRSGSATRPRPSSTRAACATAA